MEVHLTPEEEAQLARLAIKEGTDVEHIVREAVVRLLVGKTELSAGVHGGAVAEMRRLRARLSPDPEGWTTRDYVHYGRR